MDLAKTTLLNELHNYDTSTYIIKTNDFQYSNNNIFIDSSEKDLVTFDFNLDKLGKTVGPYLLEDSTDIEIKNVVIDSEFVKKINIFNTNILTKLLRTNPNKKEISEGIKNLQDAYDKNNFAKFSSLSSGIRQVFTIFSCMIEKDKNHNFILIDEPEIGLHPHWQLLILKFLDEIIENSELKKDEPQIFIATQSENILKSALEYKDALIIRLYEKNNIIKGKPINKLDLVLPYISFAEIKYIIFNIPNTDYHNQLYGILSNGRDQRGIENYIKNHTLFNSNYLNPYNFTFNNNIETLSTFVRNAIHHPENTNRSYTEEDLINSIEFMRNIIKNP